MIKYRKASQIVPFEHEINPVYLYCYYYVWLFRCNLRGRDLCPLYAIRTVGFSLMLKMHASNLYICIYAAWCVGFSVCWH